MPASHWPRWLSTIHSSRFASTPLAMMASYIAVFHAAWLMAFNFTIAAAVSAVESWRLAYQFNMLTALCAVYLMVLLNVAVPFGAQVVGHALGTDAVLAERDQLTGLLTRHAFRRLATARLEAARRQQAYFVVAMIDLDRFKQVNDSYGHSTGDDALIAVARALQDSCDATAIIGLCGGEEFVIADVWPTDDLRFKAQQICDVIAALPFAITASVGTAGIVPARRSREHDAVLIELIAEADAAMYTAKRRGGNQADHHQ